MSRYHGKRVSAPWLIVLRAYERDRKRPAPVNDGRRTMAEQAQRVRDHGLWSPSNPTGAAAPSPTAPHIRVGREDHALDINHPQNLEFIAWCKARGLTINRPIAAEPWHCEASSEAALIAFARKLTPTRRERLTAELARIRAAVKRIGHWTPKRKARAGAIKRALGITRKRPAKRTTHASRQAIDLIKSFEGFRAHPYRDAVGVWTIGYGETKGIGPHSRPVTERAASAMLERRVNHDYAPHVAKLGLPLDQNQFDALTSVIYNLGPGVLDRGRSLGDALRSGNMRAAADAILLYDKAGSPPRALPGLTRRRRAERVLFLKPVKGA